MYQNIPLELRQRMQWVSAGLDKIPLNPRTGQRASVHDAGSWGSFEEAVRSGMRYIGFVFTSGDPYCGIDLDCKNADEREYALHERILSQFDSYTERSASGKGYHIIVKAALDAGRRRESVEVYSKERFFIFTGNVVRNSPISDQQSNVDALVKGMPTTVRGDMLEDVESPYTDAQLHEIALSAVNGDKYDELCRGDWRAMGYPSQSEADFALLSILAFYTRDNEQVRRLFRYSALGKREKAVRDDRYLNTALKKIRAQQPTQADLESIAQEAKRLQLAMWQAQTLRTAPPAPRVAPPAPPAHNGHARPPLVRAGAPVAIYARTPPGLVGQLADYFYATSIRPVREISLLAAIGLVAGIAGRSYNISGTGLNQYLLLVAKTGTGKEDGPSGIERVLAAVRPRVPMVDEFLGPSAFASGQAVIRVLDKRPCFLSLLGEFGLTLQTLNDPRAPASTLLLKRVLLDLYTKSGWNKVLRSTAYSDSDKNTQTVFAPNVSFLGDSTPESFFDSLSSSDIADGLIPRLHVVEYKGERPHRNKAAGAPPSPELVLAVEDLAATAVTTRNNSTCANVQVTSAALDVLDAFDETCDKHMRADYNTVAVQLWNRAHLKALKIAGLLAVGCNLHQPAVTQEHAEWAVEFVQQGVADILERFASGDVGQGETKQQVELRRLVSEFYTFDAAHAKAYRVQDLQARGLVPYSYLAVRAARLTCFTKDRRGLRDALRGLVQQALDMEVLAQVPKNQALEQLGKREALYYRGPNF